MPLLFSAFPSAQQSVCSRYGVSSYFSLLKLDGSLALYKLEDSRTFFSASDCSMRRMRPALAVDTSNQELLSKPENTSSSSAILPTLNAFYSNNFLALHSFKYLHPDAKTLMLIKCFRIFSFSLLLLACYFIPLQLTINLWMICYSLLQGGILMYGALNVTLLCLLL